MTFGITVDSIPVTYDAGLKTKEHSKWIAKQGKRERILLDGGTFEGIDLPGRDDVLLGKLVCLTH